MYKYNIYIGKYDKDLRYQVINDDNILRVIYKTMSEFEIGNYTIYNCRGVYKHDSGKTVKESSFNIEIIDNKNWSNPHYVNKLKQALCNRLNQESVLITKQEVNILWQYTTSQNY